VSLSFTYIYFVSTKAFAAAILAGKHTAYLITTCLVTVAFDPFNAPFKGI